MPDIKPQLPATAKSHVPLCQAPHLIATYSHLEDRSIANNDASMSYYRGASVGDDLKIGYEKMIERDPLLEEHLDGVCQALLKFRREGGTLKDRALVTWRGMLTRYVRPLCHGCDYSLRHVSGTSCPRIKTARGCLYRQGFLGNERCGVRWECIPRGSLYEGGKTEKVD